MNSSALTRIGLYELVPLGRYVNVMELFALLAAVHNASRVWCAATHNRNHCLDLIRVHTVGEPFQVGWPVGTEDFTDGWQAWANDLIVAHDFLFMIKLIMVIAASSPTVVMWR